MTLLKGITTNSNQEIIPNFVTIPERGIEQPRDEWTLLFLGQLNHQKGFFDLLQAMASLTERFPSVRLEVGGTGDKQSVLKLLDRLHLKDRVVLRGWVEGRVKEDMMNKATLLVLPSYYEGLPMSVLEAMSHGLPVIATDVGGIPDIIDSGSNGMLIKPGDVAGLSSAIEALLSQPVERQRIASAAFFTVADRFCPEVVFSKLGALYARFGIVPRSEC